MKSISIPESASTTKFFSGIQRMVQLHSAVTVVYAVLQTRYPSFGESVCQ